MTFNRTIKYCLLFLLISITVLQAQSPAKKETQSASKIKASFIYSFSKSIAWPNEASISVFRICVLNSEELAKNLVSVTGTNKFKNRAPFQVINCRNRSEIVPCEILVVNTTNETELKAIYNKIKGRPILMVAENLLDFRQAMVSFVEVDRHMKWIINKTKMNEAGLRASEVVYSLSVTKEADWNDIMGKMDYYLKNSSDKDVKVSKADLKKMLGAYNDLELEKRRKDSTIKKIEDTLQKRIQMFEEKVVEYKKIENKIEENKSLIAQQEKLMSTQKREIASALIKIGEQKLVIIIIISLASISVIFLLFAIRSNIQRKKANQLLSEQKKVVEHQKQLVDEKQKEIVDSINYARRIQTALMAHDKLLSKHLPEHFVLFRPKDIVAGDFYWATPTNGGFMYVTGDCTGHGVPGAFMSLLNISKLNETINQKNITRPDLVFNDIRNEITRALNPEDSTEDSKDGMDAVLCKLDLRNMKLQYAAANNAFYVIRNHEVIVCKADKMHVGKAFNAVGMFTYYEMDLQKGDCIYTFSDGYSDQFGGPNRKRFKSVQLKELLVKISALPMTEQRHVLNETFENWKGNIEQIDDVLVIGVRV
ncbi:MAG TPA: YfiR/HmsC family protein [Bacteroidia bacterium]|nr:YfiR/HmsC family protein [Bacteroidia bacterium]